MRFTNLLLSVMTFSWPLTGCLDQATRVSIEWKKPVRLPEDAGEPAIGLAGAIIGFHQNIFLVGGGANFPNGAPWEGGVKTYHQQLYQYVLNEQNGLRFEKTILLPQATAYGASCSATDGIVYAGGEDPGGISSKVWLLRNDAGTVQISSLPNLPLPLTNAAACAYGTQVYVAGGETITGTSNRFFKLDLQNAQSGWSELTSIPYAVSHACLQVRLEGEQSELLLIGGRRKTDGDTSELYRQYSVFGLGKEDGKREAGSWRPGGELPFPLAAALSVKLPDQSILLMGGDDGRTFSRVEELIAEISRAVDNSHKLELIQQKNKLLSRHPGFQRAVLQLPAGKTEWIELDQLPFDAPVTSQALLWNNWLFLPSGEIKAGLRSPYIQQAQLTIPTKHAN